MKFAKTALLACTMFTAFPACAEDGADAETPRSDIIVTGAREVSMAGTKTDTPLIETPQPVTIVSSDVYLAQGAVSIADTLRYVAGVQANNYGPDSRVDGSFIRGIDPLQFRDGMRDLFSYYASIRSDPYNFSQIEVVRGPASVLFGSGSLGGLINMVSKRPQYEFGGEVSVRYGSFDRKEALADITGPITGNLAARVVARVRDANSQTDHVPDDRIMLAPSLSWRPGANTELTLIGLYQEDDGGSTAQFLPLYGTLYGNPNGELPHDRFIGKPGWDRYDGRLLQGTAMLDQRFGEGKLSLKARYIDSDLTYLTHYPDNYSNPTDPFLDPAKRVMGLYVDGSIARMEIFSTDNNFQYRFNTGAQIEHVLLAGIDYSWNKVRKTGGFALETIDVYAPDYAALSDYGGGLPEPTYSAEDTSQNQTGFYVQDQIRLWDRVSVVLGARHDHVRTQASGGAVESANATTFRAGVIGELVPGVSPFFSYTESFQPIPGDGTGRIFRPTRGNQFEGGVKFHPDDATLLTITGYYIKENNRLIDDPAKPQQRIQAGKSTSKGFEIEASRRLPGDYELIANYSYNEAYLDEFGKQLDNVPKVNASVWGTKNFDLGEARSLRIGAGVRHSAANWSFGAAFPSGVRTPAYTLVDALVELNWQRWQIALNATNLFDKRYYSACLARGDCFNGADRNIYATLSYRF
ncbi:iron complex outermembrane receptor protein [Sphingobium xanthum]|uniref:TonB-dependent siderophore receptor n=1 Tax=Sphingobium xanthum TaxID=1387165 RepID=UPI001C8BFE44|nr:TonB-dependent siderophore receptor [Sphingobium xanthum]